LTALRLPRPLRPSWREHFSVAWPQITLCDRLYEFHRRGLSSVYCEWKLLATTHNILKMWRMAGAIG
jgi:hypothetical protein